MKPTLNPGDMVIYANTGFNTGDIVVYCTTPSFCIVHRVIHVNNNTIVTKGDNNPAPDPPINGDGNRVKGKVVLALPLLVWAPVLVALLAPSVIYHVRIRQHYLVELLVTTLLFISLVFFSNNRGYLATPSIRYPTVYLSKVEVSGCSIVVEYANNIPMEITSGVFAVDGVDITKRVSVIGMRVLIDAPELISVAYQDRGYLLIQANVTFNTTTVLTGEYRALVIGEPLKFWASGSSVMLENRNCFPVNVTVATPSSQITLTVPGHSVIAVEVEPHATANITYRVWGEELRAQVSVLG